MNLKKGATGNPCSQEEKEFFKGLKKTFWAPKLRYEAILNQEIEIFLPNMKENRELYNEARDAIKINKMKLD